MVNVIEMNNISWKRAKKTILSSINWQVKKGEHWAVLGLNGSGKTTLLNMVNGYIWPTTGQVNVLGNAYGKIDLRELRKSIGWVSSALEEKINGRQLVQKIVVSGKYAQTVVYHEPSQNDYDKAYEIMTLMGCDHLRDRTYETCSNGEKQKILIARGIMADPQLLILDEPTSGLDFVAREELMKMIERLTKQENAPTIILITHHIEEILPSFSHILLLQDGSVFDQGKREEVLNDSCLSAFFNQPITVDWRNNRAWMTLAETKQHQ